MSEFKQLPSLHSRLFSVSKHIESVGSRKAVEKQNSSFPQTLEGRTAYCRRTGGRWRTPDSSSQTEKSNVISNNLLAKKALRHKSFFLAFLLLFYSTYESGRDRFELWPIATAESRYRVESIGSVSGSTTPAAMAARPGGQEPTRVTQQARLNGNQNALSHGVVAFQ